MRLPKPIALILLCLMLGSGQASLAANHAVSPNLSGLVQDTAGAVISRAHIWIHEQTGKEDFTAVTDISGKFSIHLPDGYYDVMIASPAFVPFSKCVWIQGGKETKLKVKLHIDEEKMQMMD